jgi:hypothetical protein
MTGSVMAVPASDHDIFERKPNWPKAASKQLVFPCASSRSTARLRPSRQLLLRRNDGFGC